MLTENEIKAKSFVIGRQLEREREAQEYNMGAAAADKFSQDKARGMGANDTEAAAIAKLAMLFVINGGIHG